ncbi:hypothetical protein D3C71_234500 [compost metagenome]
MNCKTGTVYFLHGRHVELTGMCHTVAHILHYEVRTLEDFNEDHKNRYIGATSMTPLSELEPLCSELFPLHSTVRSLLSANVDNALIGTVVGYEYPKNRVIVVSSKIAKYPDQRARWSYGIKELAEYTVPKLGFEVGGIYKINLKDVVLAVDELFNPGYVSLVFTEGQQDTKRNVPMNGTLDDYLKHGIHTIEYLEG